MKKKHLPLDENTVRIIKISKEALFEFIYEHFIDEQERAMEIDPTSVANAFEIDWENGQFIFCAYQFEDQNGNFIELPKGIDLHAIMKQIPDTTDTMYKNHRYQDYTKAELIELSKNNDEKR